jgi:hypothetical protein
VKFEHHLVVGEFAPLHSLKGRHLVRSQPALPGDTQVVEIYGCSLSQDYTSRGDTI